MNVNYKTTKNDSIQGLRQFIFTMPPDSFFGNFFTSQYSQTLVIYDTKGEILQVSLELIKKEGN
tara:strand:- start:534 stop:725 length:192 start_codon:yes stop_codon:yes gene_type:complete